MIRAAKAGAPTIDKLEAMTCGSVGLDMIAVPGDTPQALWRL